MNTQKFLSDKEARHLEELLYLHLTGSPRDCLLLLITMKTGARASEVLAIKKTDVNVDNKSVFITGQKGSNSRELPLPPQIFKHLTRYMTTVETDLLFPISYDRMYQIWLNFRPTKKGLHCLRHSRAVEVYKRSKDIRLVQQMLGHKSITSTQVYETYVHTQNALRKVML